MLVTIDVYSSHKPRSATVGKGNIYLLFSFKPKGARNECPFCHVFRVEMNALFAMFSEVLES